MEDSPTSILSVSHRIIRVTVVPDTTVDQAQHANRELADYLDRIDRAAAKTDTEPTEAQREAGNYAKGKLNIHGLTISIENPKGSTRSGKSRDGKEWSQEMKSHYGYILGTEGRDKDHVDVFIGDQHPHCELVFVVNQVDPGTKDFDEHKVIFGAINEDQARRLYLENYEDGWKGLGSIYSLTMPQFKWWLEHADTTREIEDGMFAKYRKKAADVHPSGDSGYGRQCGPAGTDGGSDLFDLEDFADAGNQKVAADKSKSTFAEEYRFGDYRDNFAQHGPEHRFDITRNGREIGGVAVMDVPGHDAGWIRGLYVSPRHREKGLARKLMEHVLDAYGHKPLELHVGPYKDKALGTSELAAFYTSLGFKPYVPAKTPVPDIMRREADVKLEEDEPDDEEKHEKKADAAPGLPSRQNFGDWDALQPGQNHDLVIQHHLAQKAGPHYDFRFGTPDTGLYSWATRNELPEPGQRILAVQQPVHRYGYKDFEGDIPLGRYGGGSVKKHDSGQIMLTKVSPGEIHFTRMDKKHPERFMLTKWHGQRDRDWLMINTTPSQSLPYQKIHYTKIPADQIEQTLSKLDPAASVQAKIDGASSLIKLLKDGVELTSYRQSKQTGRPILHTERFFHGRPAIQTPPNLVGSVLRGELYGVRQGDKPGGGEAGADNPGDPLLSDTVQTAIHPSELGGILNATPANAIAQQRDRKIQLRNALFDVQQVGKHPVDFDQTSYAERRAMLGEILPLLEAAAPGRFHLSQEAEPGKAMQMWQDIAGGKNPLTREGVVIHPTHGKPMKSKLTEDHDVHIHSFFPGEGRRASTVGGFQYSLQPGGEPVGKVGTGFDDATLADMAANPDDWIGRVARVRAQEQLASGALRAPSFLARHEDI